MGTIKVNLSVNPGGDISMTTTKRPIRNHAKRFALVRGCQATMARTFADGVAAKLPWAEISDRLFASIRKIEASITGEEYAGCVAFVHAYREYAIRGLVEWRKYFRGALVMSDAIPDGAWHEVETDKGAFTYIGAPDRVFMGPKEPEESEGGTPRARRA